MKYFRLIYHIKMVSMNSSFLGHFNRIKRRLIQIIFIISKELIIIYLLIRSEEARHSTLFKEILTFLNCKIILYRRKLKI